MEALKRKRERPTPHTRVSPALRAHLVDRASPAFDDWLIALARDICAEFGCVATFAEAARHDVEALRRKAIAADPDNAPRAAAIALRTEELLSKIHDAEAGKAAGLERELVSVDALLEAAQRERSSVHLAASSLPDAELDDEYALLVARLDALAARARAAPRGRLESADIRVVPLIDPPSASYPQLANVVALRPPRAADFVLDGRRPLTAEPGETLTFVLRLQADAAAGLLGDPACVSAVMNAVANSICIDAQYHPCSASSSVQQRLCVCVPGSRLAGIDGCCSAITLTAARRSTTSIVVTARIPTTVSVGGRVVFAGMSLNGDALSGRLCLPMTVIVRCGSLEVGPQFCLPLNSYVPPAVSALYGSLDLSPRFYPPEESEGDDNDDDYDDLYRDCDPSVFAIDSRAPTDAVYTQWCASMSGRGEDLKEYWDFMLEARSSLHRAVMLKDCIRDVVARGAGVDERTALGDILSPYLSSRLRESGGWTSLHWAVSVSNHIAIDVLLSAGAYVDATDVKGTTPLHIACCSLDKEAIVRTLCEAGADANAVNDTGNVPSTILLALLRRHQYLEVRDPRCIEQTLGVMRVLFSAGASPSASLHTLWTPLEAAISTGDDSAVSLMISSGADVNIAFPDGDFPLHAALRCESRTTLIPLLLRAGASTSAVSSLTKYTPLQQIAHDSNFLDAVKDCDYAETLLYHVSMLIDAGARTCFAANENGRTLLVEFEHRMLSRVPADTLDGHLHALRAAFAPSVARAVVASVQVDRSPPISSSEPGGM